MSSSNPTPLVLLFSLKLTDNARTKLPDWYGDVCSQARNLCAQHELTGTGALILVARDNTWNSYPGNLTNAAQVTAGPHAAVYEARLTWALPNAPAATASAGTVPFPSTGMPHVHRNHPYRQMELSGMETPHINNTGNIIYL
jgi:hypothetical protein